MHRYTSAHDSRPRWKAVTLLASWNKKLCWDASGGESLMKARIGARWYPVRAKGPRVAGKQSNQGESGKVIFCAECKIELPHRAARVAAPKMASNGRGGWWHTGGRTRVGTGTDMHRHKQCNHSL